MERIIKGSKRVLSCWINIDDEHHTVCLDKRKKYINNAVVILTYPSPQKTLRLLKLLYFFKDAKYYSAIFIESKLGSVG